jgi:hypothetical protein
MSRNEEFEDGGELVEPMKNSRWQSHPQLELWLGNYLGQIREQYAINNADKIKAQKDEDNAAMEKYYQDNPDKDPSRDKSWESIQEATKDMPEPTGSGQVGDLDSPEWLK